MKGKLTNIAKLSNGSVQVTVEVSATNNQCNVLADLRRLDKTVDVSIKKEVKARSMDSNRYIWALCNELAKVLYTTKEEVYQEAIRKVGVFDYVKIKDTCVDRYIKSWNNASIGNYAELFSEGDTEGTSFVRTYYGSSTYNSKEMSLLINYIVDECKEQGIETATPDEIDRLIKMIKEKN